MRPDLSLAPLCVGLALAVGFSADPTGAEQQRFTFFTSGTHYRWRTTGPHGHLAYCREEACDDEDWRRGNLDNALGLRLGLERGGRRWGNLALAAGGELGLFFTEYNLSQRDVVVGSAFATAGATLGGVRGGAIARAGVGAFASDDGRGGPAGFVEVGAEAVMAAARLRLSARRVWLGSLEAEEASLTVRAAPGEVGGTNWYTEFAVGGSRPGVGGERNAGLGRGALWQWEVGRELAGGQRMGLLLGSLGRESRFESVYRGVPGNQRGREVWEVGARWDTPLLFRGGWEVRGGAGLRFADWRDEEPLLLTSSGEPRRGGVDAGMGFTLEAGRWMGEGLRVVAAVEPVIWPKLDLVEVRLRVGLATGSPAAGRPTKGGPSCRTLVCDWGRDLGALALRPGRLEGSDWRALGVAALAVGAVATLDESVRDAVQRRSTSSSRDAAATFRPVSFWGPVVGSTAVWGVAQLAGEEGTAAVAADALEAVLLTVLVVVPALKEVSGRARPAAGLGSSHLRPFSEYKSFPSGEVAQAFALATVARESGAATWLEGVLWGFAGAVTWSRLELDRHWASDAVAGALVGVAMGRWVLGRSVVRRGRGQAALVPSAVPGGVGVQIQARW